MKTIIIHKKHLLTNFFLCLCLTIMAQTDYYYYKGKKIPLIVNKDKVFQFRAVLYGIVCIHCVVETQI